MQRKSAKSRLVAFLLCFFFGTFGIHRFYVGKVGTGLLMIFTLGGLGIWTLIDFIQIIIGSFRDKEGLPVSDWTPNGVPMPSTADNLSGLEKLADLKAKGIINEEEFATKKREMLRM